MEKDPTDESSSNIPHMRLFLTLKAKFPELTDADITECIQRFGLNRERCEEELTHKVQELKKGYYYRNRPIRSSSTQPQSPLQEHKRYSPLSPTSPSIPPSVVVPPRPNANQTTAHTEERKTKITEQMTRKDKLEEQLKRRLEEKKKLADEVKNLTNDLKAKENYQREDVDRSKNKIQAIKQENEELQFRCDKIKKIILDSGNSIWADTDHGRPTPPIPAVSNPASPTSERDNPHITPNSSNRQRGVVPLPPAPRVSPQHSVPITRNQTDSNQPPSRHLPDDGGRDWACTKCTFINSHFLNECEMCSHRNFPPQRTPHQGGHVESPNPGGPCYCCHHNRPGELQDIHIQVRHQNLQSLMRDI